MNKNLDNGYMPPQAVEFEEAILGALMLESDSIIEIIGILNVSSFYKDSNQKVYAAILELFHKSEAVDILTVCNKLKEKGHLKLIGGAYFISQLTNRVASAVNIEHHARIVYQKEMGRNLIRIGSEVVKDSYDETKDVFEVTDKLLNDIQSLGSISESNQKTNTEILAEAKIDVENANTFKGITGATTGIDGVDRFFGGYQKTDLIILAARPGMGKTSQALCEANNMAYIDNKEEEDVIFFSLEMGHKQLIKRLISINSRIGGEQLRSGRLTDEDWRIYNETTSMLMGDKLIIIDDIYTLNGIVRKAKQLCLKGKVKAIFIDYLQLIIHDVGSRNKENEVSEVSRTLKLMAKQLDVPLKVLSQLNRAVETRGGNKIPQLSDLRDSGSIEQDADIVQFLYRPEYYKIMEDENGQSTEGLALMMVAKHRNGGLGDIKMKFIGGCTKFENIEENTQFPTDDLPF